jgi:hypothetical protein
MNSITWPAGLQYFLPEGWKEKVLNAQWILCFYVYLLKEAVGLKYHLGWISELYLKLLLVYLMIILQFYKLYSVIW